MHFSSLLSLPFGGRGQGLSDHEAIPLAGITVREFDIFLTMFYPACVCQDLLTSLLTDIQSLDSKIGVYDAATVDDWSAILALASHWTFPSIKDLSIQKLLSIASPIDKIVLGRKYRIDDWLAGAYVEVCSREAALTEEEGDRLGMKDVIKITRLRQGSKGTSFSPIEGVDELMDAFGLPVVADTHTAVDSEKDAISIERSTGIHPEENAAFAAETECTHEQKNDNPSENESTGIADDQVAPALACSDCGHPAFFCICGLHLAVSALADRTVPPKKKKLKEKKGKKGSRLHSQFDFPQLPRQ